MCQWVLGKNPAQKKSRKNPAAYRKSHSGKLTSMLNFFRSVSVVLYFLLCEVQNTVIFKLIFRLVWFSLATLTVN